MGETIATYLAGFGFCEVLAKVDGQGSVSSALRDRLRTTVGWLDANGAVAEHVVRDAYGVLAAPAGSVTPFGYTGHAEDPTGLVWGRARCYAPTTGAWTSEDPVFTEGRYGYVGGHVALSVDPDGRTEVVFTANQQVVIACVVSYTAAAAVAYIWLDENLGSNVNRGAACGAGVGGAWAEGLTGTAAGFAGALGGALIGSLFD